MSKEGNEAWGLLDGCKDPSLSDLPILMTVPIALSAGLSVYQAITRPKGDDITPTPMMRN